MLNEKTVEYNPRMLEAAIALHQAGALRIPTLFLDLDTIVRNAQALVESAREAGVTLLGMMKQDCHNPFVTRLLRDCGFAGFSAVESSEAFRLHEYGFPIGQVGHLSQFPLREARDIVAMNPGHVTVYTCQHAKAISDAAVALGRRQKVYVSVTRKGDGGRIDTMTGGYTLENCVSEVRRLLDLEGIEVDGLVDHVTIDYETEDDAYSAKPSQAFFTTLEARELLERELPLSGLGINVAGNANAVTIPVLANEYGVTEVEPGAAITGSARFHALQDMPEIPAKVFVTEATHDMGEYAFAIGGGFNSVWRVGDPDSYRGMFGFNLAGAARDQLVLGDPEVIDFHGVFRRGERVTVPGETVLFASMSQSFNERGYVTAVSGIESGKPHVVGVTDKAGNILGPGRWPLSPAEARKSLDRVSQLYGFTA